MSYLAPLMVPQRPPRDQKWLKMTIKVKKNWKTITESIMNVRFVLISDPGGGYLWRLSYS